MEFRPDLLSEALKDPTVRLSGLANVAGVSVSSLYALRDRKKEPSAKTLGKIASALKKPIGYFYEENSFCGEQEEAS